MFFKMFLILKAVVIVEVSQEVFHFIIELTKWSPVQFYTPGRVSILVGIWSRPNINDLN